MDDKAAHADWISPISLLVPDYLADSPWVAHAPFAFWLVEALAPRSYVELGVHNGFSYFTICQTVEKVGLKTDCYGVGLWLEAVRGEQSSQILETVKRNNARYQSFSTLMPLAFLDALARFPDRSIDLLHIDGRYSFEEAKHAFQSWLPKTSEMGIVLLHHTNAWDSDIGVQRFFRDLRGRYPTFEFLHGRGLGVVAVGQIPPRLAGLFAATPERADFLRETYRRLGEAVGLRQEMQNARLRSAENEKLALECQRLLQVTRSLSAAAINLDHQRADLTALLANARRPSPSLPFPASLRRRLPVGRPKDYAGLVRDYTTISNSPLFDPNWYLEAYKNVAENGEDPIHHFLKFGCDYALSPGPCFDSKSYLIQNPDARSRGINPLLHYIRTGAAEGRSLGPSTHDLSPSARLKVPAPFVAIKDEANRWPISMPDMLALRDHQPRVRIAVVLHIFYAELGNELIERCTHLPEDFDLFISLVKGHSDFSYDELRCRCPNAHIFVFENRGRDILPFMAFAETGVLFKYDFVCKMHTKQSPSHHDGKAWRRHLIDGVLPSRDGAAALIKAMDEDQDLGIIVADDQVHSRSDAWLGNIVHASKLAPMLGFEVGDAMRLPFAGGSIFWIRPFLLFDLVGLKVEPESYELEPLEIDGALAHTIERLFSVSCIAAGMRIAQTSKVLRDNDWPHPTAKTRRPRVLAFYSPQFYSKPENDLRGGRDFTDWVDVAKSRPLFSGHRQPILPGELGFADLRLSETREAQAALAKQYDLYGFCYHYYWFNGGSRVFCRQIDEVLHSGKPDFPFMICWDNEPLDFSLGGRADVFPPQDHSTGWEEGFGLDIAPFLKDRRYVCTEGDRRLPVLFISRIMRLPQPKESMARLRAVLSKAGVGDVHLAAGWLAGDKPALPDDPARLGLDAFFELPPHNLPTVPFSLNGASPRFAGDVFKYNATVTLSLAQLKEKATGTRYHSAMAGWDNTASRGHAAEVFHGATPSHFRRWVRGIVKKATEQDEARSDLIFINSWNNWAEGSSLEPDCDFGRGWLEALRSARPIATFSPETHRLRPIESRLKVGRPSFLGPRREGELE